MVTGQPCETADPAGSTIFKELTDTIALASSLPRDRAESAASAVMLTLASRLPPPLFDELLNHFTPSPSRAPSRRP